MVPLLRAFAILSAGVVSISGAAQQSPYTLQIGVNEVSLTFHVSDSRGNAVTDLSAADFELRDNGIRQHKIVEFHSYRNLPIRAGFLMDASQSMQTDLERDLFIANAYATRLLHKGTDRAFVMGFGTAVQVTQEWTDDPGAIGNGLGKIPTEDYGTSGTAIFDSLYRACRDRWTSSPEQMTGNFILLFSDGVDNASHARIAPPFRQN